jgi:deoxycytidine triphosphate deaminase
MAVQGGLYVAGLLCKAEILGYFAAGKLIHDGDTSRTRGCSYDCGVGDIFFDGQMFKRASGQQGVKVPPGGVVALFTREILDLPADIAGTAFPINAMSSRGLLVLNPGHVDPGFRGHLTVKALNLRKSELLLRFDEPIFTVLFEKLPHATDTYRNNVDQADRARDFHQREVETTPRTILDACDLSKLTLAGPTRDEMEAALDRRWNTEKVEVGEMIRAHWMARWSFVLMLIAATAACISVGLSLWPLIHPSPSIMAAPPERLGVSTSATPLQNSATVPNPERKADAPPTTHPTDGKKN